MIFVYDSRAPLFCYEGYCEIACNLNCYLSEDCVAYQRDISNRKDLKTFVIC